MFEMRPALVVSFGLALVEVASGQSAMDQNPASDRQTVQEQKHGPGAAADIGGGVGTIGGGAAKGVGSAAKGTAKGAGELVTLHPIGAVESVGKGAAGAGKDVTVGAAKGTGKVARGIGKVFKKIL
jgi:hypothetical protein